MSYLAPEPEHDACGVGFLADLSHRASHDVIRTSPRSGGCDGPSRRAGGRRPDRRRRGSAGRDAASALPARAGGAEHVRVPERHLGAVCLFLPRDFDDAAATARAKIEAAVRAGRRRAAALARPARRHRRPRRVRAPHRAAPTSSCWSTWGPGTSASACASCAQHRLAHRSRSCPARRWSAPRRPRSSTRALLSSTELGDYFADLRDPAFVVALRASFTSASAPTPRRSGAWCSRSTTSRTTARSTRSPATARGCRRAACPMRSVGERLAELQHRDRRDARRRATASTKPST